MPDPENIHYDVVVIGAGIGGVLTALELPTNKRVLLIDAGEDILPINSTSYNECYKLHTGMHYMKDKETAQKCLDNSLAFARSIPRECMAGKDDPSDPCHRGSYFIMEDSLVGQEEAKDVALFLQNYYRKKVEEDPGNQVFGDPENFIKFLNPADYEHFEKNITTYDKEGNEQNNAIVLGIETGESQINFHALKKHLRDEILGRTNITFLPSTKVNSLSHNPANLGYCIRSRNKESHALIHTTSSVVNCAWQNIETINNTLGTSEEEQQEEYENRLKATILVDLPEELHGMKSSLFALGPYVSISVLDGGKQAILASERHTNVTSAPLGTRSDGGKLYDTLQELTLTHERGAELAENIRRDCVHYLEPLSNATIKELHIGFVRSLKGSIYEKDSAIHTRLDSGVTTTKSSFNLISNACMKMCYGASNATLVSECVKENQVVLEKATALKNDLIARIKQQISLEDRDLSKVICVDFKNALITAVNEPDFDTHRDQYVEQLSAIIIERIEPYIQPEREDHASRQSPPLEMDARDTVAVVADIPNNEVPQEVPRFNNH